MIFGIIHKDLKRKIEFYDDLVRLKKLEFGDQYLFLAPNKGFIDKVVRKDVKDCLTECKGSINLVYVSSELSIVSNSNLLIRVTFDFDEKLIEAQVKLVFAIMDVVISSL